MNYMSFVRHTGLKELHAHVSIAVSLARIAANLQTSPDADSARHAMAPCQMSQLHAVVHYISQNVMYAVPQQQH